MNSQQRTYGATTEYHDDPGYNPFTDSPQQSRGASSHEPPAHLSEVISTNIFKINSNATSLERASKQIGTEKDSKQLRERIHSSEQSTNYLIKETAEAFHYFAESIPARNKPFKLQFERLKGEFKETIKRYNNLQKAVAQKVKSCVLLNSQKKDGTLINFDDTTNDEASLLDEQRQARAQQLQAQEAEAESNLALYQERENQIRQLEGDIIDINELFRDLGTLVHEQGDQIDTIEANVETAHSQVEAGNEQLVKASTYQRKARKKMCILAIVLVVVAGILALIIYLSVK